MTDVPIWDPIERCLWGVAITLLLIAALLYFGKSKQRENRNERLLLIGFGFMYLGNMLTTLFFFLRGFFVSGYFIGTTFYGDLENPTPTYWFFEVAAGVALFIEMGIFFYIYEKIFKHTKYLFTSVQAILVLFGD